MNTNDIKTRTCMNCKKQNSFSAFGSIGSCMRADIAFEADNPKEALHAQACRCPLYEPIKR